MGPQLRVVGSLPLKLQDGGPLGPALVVPKSVCLATSRMDGGPASHGMMTLVILTHPVPALAACGILRSQRDRKVALSHQGMEEVKEKPLNARE